MPIKMKFLLIISVMLQSCIGAGDIFASRERILSKYYLLERESGGYNISYQVDEGYLGRTPYNFKVMAYGIKDSLLIAQIQDYDSICRYHIINMNKDSDFADEKDYLFQSMTPGEYDTSWLGKQKVQLRSVIAQH